MKIRTAEKKDTQAIVALIADDKLGITREDFQIPLPQEYLIAFENINRDNNQELIVSENDNGEIIGTLQVSFIQYLTYKGGIRAQIEAVRTRKDFRRTGVGAEMIEWAIRRAKERNAHLIQLTTDKKRPEALHFYEKLGFIVSHQGMKLHFNSNKNNYGKIS